MISVVEVRDTTRGPLEKGKGRFIYKQIMGVKATNFSDCDEV
jgi:hypothetical protein